MEKQRRSKVIIILILLVAVFGMSIGLATSANRLTISSSANVKPNQEGFAVNIYGIEQVATTYSFSRVVNDVSAYSSKTVGAPLTDGGALASSAIIDNYSFSISNLNATFTGPNQKASYYFIIKNEGSEDTYLNVDKFKDFYNGSIAKSCFAATGTTQSLVDAACENIKLVGQIGEITSDGDIVDPFEDATDISGTYLIASGDYVHLYVSIIYGDGAQADGEFTVDFDDVVLDFSSIA